MPTRVLLIPNVSPWILGDIAREIVEHLGDEFEFSYLSELTALARPDLLRRRVAEADVIHCLTESATGVVARLGGPLPPVVTWIHHLTEWSPSHELAAQRSSAIVASTPDWATALRSRVPAHVPISVVRYGVDVDRFAPGSPDRSHFGLASDAFVVGLVGSKGSDEDGGRKGLATASLAIEQAARRIPRLHAWLVGPGWEGEVRRLGARGISASTTGYLPASELPRVYGAMDVYLMPSRVEGGPCTVLESMAAGVVTVATAVGLVPLAIADGVTGFRCEPGDAAMMADCLEQSAALPVATRTSIAASARAEVVAHWQWGQTLSALRAVYAGAAMARPRVPQALEQPRADVQQQMDHVRASDAIIWSLHSLVTRRGSLRHNVQMLRAMLRGLSLRHTVLGAITVVRGIPAMAARRIGNGRTDSA